MLFPLQEFPYTRNYDCFGIVYNIKCFILTYFIPRELFRCFIIYKHINDLYQHMLYYKE